MELFKCLNLESIELLQKNKLLKPLVRSEVLKYELTSIKIDEETKQDLIHKFKNEQGISDNDKYKTFLENNHLNDSDIEEIAQAKSRIKKYTSIAGLDSKKYSGHSLRSGFATSAAELGAEERSIMAMTGHKTTQMVRRYIREANIFKNNALNKIKI